MVEATARVDVLNKMLGLGTDTAEMEAAGCGLGSDGMGEEEEEEKKKRLGPKWGVMKFEGEAVARVVEKCDRYGQD
jgi:hypothetical protein